MSKHSTMKRRIHSKDQLLHFIESSDGDSRSAFDPSDLLDLIDRQSVNSDSNHRGDGNSSVSLLSSAFSLRSNYSAGAARKASDPKRRRHHHDSDASNSGSDYQSSGSHQRNGDCSIQLMNGRPRSNSLGDQSSVDTSSYVSGGASTVSRSHSLSSLHSFMSYESTDRIDLAAVCPTWCRLGHWFHQIRAMVLDHPALQSKENRRKLLVAGMASILLLGSFFNVSRYQHSLMGGVSRYHQSSEGAMTEEQHRQQQQMRQGETVSFNMCGRETPYRYSVDPLLPPSKQRPIHHDRRSSGKNDAEGEHDGERSVFDWPKQNKILLLRNDGKFGHMGNQVNSLLHAFDYARDHQLHIGMLFHSWSMDVLHSMFYETDNFDDLGSDLLHDLNVLVVRNQTQLGHFDEVVSQNSQQLYFYRTTNAGVDHWRETMELHKAVLRRLFLRYNRGYGYVHNGLRAQDVCSELDMFFHEKVGEVKYSVSKCHSIS